MSTTIRLELPAKMPSQNEWQRWHFQRQRRFKENCMFMLRARLNELGLYGRHTTTGKRHLRVERHSSGRLDRGNFIGGCKALLDALRDLGLIRDDSEAWLEDEYVQVKVKRGDAKTVIELSELAS